MAHRYRVLVIRSISVDVIADDADEAVADAFDVANGTPERAWQSEADVITRFHIPKEDLCESAQT